MALIKLVEVLFYNNISLVYMERDPLDGVYLAVIDIDVFKYEHYIPFASLLPLQDTRQ